ncbi:ribosomal protein S18 acetylase RimI-like enzyme [Orenia metallireducens]|jgi:GNAT superfamily N-acetyltransferase|uniref:Ribosomal protein S18 acetylase RimI n=1 Tax=Orenia metallireducens TaxID=1413210 RepID=A0A285HNU8_9FIRM|nr:GNAT family N-acetyltransferase [Orenia metallireducens]PRX27989.1 ribosomal protein S18 acetylase RimI-like enzyme [Orenia metallireducens]SNY37409.1 Ribosomal protein S18 acetylase RimI [Orenia metallireducens]
MKGTKIDFIVRNAKEKDSEYLALLCEQLGYSMNYRKLKSPLKKILKDDEHIIYVAQLASGEIAGWIHAYLYKLFYADLMAEIGGIVVDKLNRRKGIGKELMRYVESWAKEKGCYTVSLRSNVLREKAHLFYQQIGYKNEKEQFTFRKRL